MRSVAMDVFAMPEVTVDGETYDCVILAVDRHSGYIVAVPGKKSKKKDKKDKHGVGLQAKTVANAMIRHWLTILRCPSCHLQRSGQSIRGDVVQDDVQAHGDSARQDRGIPQPLEWPG